MFEIIFGLLIVSVMVGALFLFMWIAVQFNASFLVPFIGSSIFWLMAAYNLRDAATKVEATGYVYSRVERMAALIRGVCMIAMTVPFFFRGFPYPLHFSIGSLVFMFVASGLLHGGALLMRSDDG